jgi:predicted nucleotidyltransferase
MKDKNRNRKSPFSPPISYLPSSIFHLPTPLPLMKNKHTILQIIRGIEPEIRDFGVANLWMFGSAARDETIIHDVDFLVEFVDRPSFMAFMNLKFFLEEKIGMPVDLFTKQSCPDRFMRRIKSDLLHVA